MTRRPTEKPVLHREDASERRRNLVPNVEAVFQRRRRRASVQPNQRTPGSRTRSSSSGINSAATAPTTRFSLRNQRHFLRSGKERIIQCNPRPPLQLESRMFEDLKERTGFGWNPETKIVTANVEHWSALIQIDDKYAKFMGRGLDHYDDLCYIFGNNTASGLYRYAPSQDPATSDEEQRLYDAALGRAARSSAGCFPFTPAKVQVGAEASISHAFLGSHSMDNHHQFNFDLNEPYVAEDEGAYNVDETSNPEQEGPHESQGSDVDEEVGSVVGDTTTTSTEDSDNPDKGDDAIALYIIEEDHPGSFLWVEDDNGEFRHHHVRAQRRGSKDTVGDRSIWFCLIGSLKRMSFILNLDGKSTPTGSFVGSPGKLMAWLTSLHTGAGGWMLWGAIGVSMIPPDIVSWDSDG
ncbi:hypothetical protein CJ030_MR1G028873 [Morella rubra]|uniref:Myb/SANT-like domain-containing protein n=1 Tax=Morella rubra TaxID=262757 RepID=A0A6A1WQ95_9ROSI|nr:hypothetical protein CJ030_MR1G028873 [Morella rubra]